MRLASRGSWLIAALVTAFFARPSAAVPIGPSCDTCQGSTYDLSYDPTPVATSATSETWRITLTIDTSGYSGTGSYIDTVAVKISNAFLDAELFSAPGGLASWVEMTGGLNAAGCSGSGSGYDCVRWATSLALAPAVPGATYEWVFDVTVPTGRLFVGEAQSSLKARYVNGSGVKVGDLVSENVTLSQPAGPSVPEPVATLLLAEAAAAHLLWRRRRRSSTALRS
jgi:hypothetical protein